jgi:hypothetical protein
LVLSREPASVNSRFVVIRHDQRLHHPPFCIAFSVASSNVAAIAFVTKHPANRSAAHPRQQLMR